MAKSPRNKNRRSKKAGLPPGTMVYIGAETTAPIKVKSFHYDQDGYHEASILNLETSCPVIEERGITWLEVDGIHKVDVIENLGKLANLHPLVLEDIVNASHRPKLEEYDGYLFIVLKMVQFDAATHEVLSEQVSLVLGPNYVISFQENEKDVFDKVRERIRNGKGRLRKCGADYLAYALMDAIVDNFFHVLEGMGEELEELEHELVTNPTQTTLDRIYSFKRSMMFIRRAGWPLREITMALERSDSDLVSDPTKLYLRDVYDHSVEIIDIIENLRDISSGMIDVYLSSMSNRLNEVMKVLTIIATIFMPLTFISSIYGMNFHYMPELEWHMGYPLVLLSMAAIGLGMLIFFRRRRWL